MVEKIYWAVEKVRVFSPATKEKATLIAIAGYARPDGHGSIVSYRRLANDTGQSIRTVRRHVKVLFDRGELVTSCSLDRKHRTNQFYIPIVARTLEDLLVERQFLGLPLFMEVPRAKLSLPQGQTVPAPGTNWPSNINDNMKLTPKSEDFELKTKKRKKEFDERLRQNDADAVVDIAPETQAFIAAALEGVRPVYTKPQATIVEPEASTVPFTRQEWEESLEETKKLLDQLRYGS